MEAVNFGTCHDFTHALHFYDWLHGLHDQKVSSEHLRFFVFSFFIILFLFGSVRQIKLATRQLLGAR